jgi:hypothetical protein
LYRWQSSSEFGESRVSQDPGNSRNEEVDSSIFGSMPASGYRR